MKKHLIVIAIIVLIASCRRHEQRIVYDDSEINDDDLIGLYSSKANGQEFKRISPYNQQLIDWESRDIQGLLFFRTMEDIDKNGQFDENDRINLYEYNLLTEDTIKLIFNDMSYSELKKNTLPNT